MANGLANNRLPILGPLSVANLYSSYRQPFDFNAHHIAERYTIRTDSLGLFGAQGGFNRDIQRRDVFLVEGDVCSPLVLAAEISGFHFVGSVALALTPEVRSFSSSQLPLMIVNDLTRHLTRGLDHLARLLVGFKVCIKL
jgi:hypothetical protein